VSNSTPTLIAAEHGDDAPAHATVEHRGLGVPVAELASSSGSPTADGTVVAVRC
jgi:hypothetical protein